MEATRTQKQMEEAAAKQTEKIVKSMTPANWLVLTQELEVSRAMIEETFMLAVMLWKKNNPTPRYLSDVMNMTEGEIATGLGFDPDEEFLPEPEEAGKE